MHFLEILSFRFNRDKIFSRRWRNNSYTNKVLKDKSSIFLLLNLGTMHHYQHSEIGYNYQNE
jgi:hypothetical protein